MPPSSRVETMYHLRRTDRRIEDIAFLKKILKTANYVTLAMSMNNEPYLVSLSHCFDEERNCIYFHCAKEGKKLDYLQSNSRVWGQAILDHGYSLAEKDCTYLYASVHFSGKVAFLDNIDEKRQAMVCMMKQLDDKSKPLIAQLENDRLSKTMIGRIDIEYMSGKESK